MSSYLVITWTPLCNGVPNNMDIGRFVFVHLFIGRMRIAHERGRASAMTTIAF